MLALDRLALYGGVMLLYMFSLFHQDSALPHHLLSEELSVVLGLVSLTIYLNFLPIYFVKHPERQSITAPIVCPALAAV